MNTRVTTHNAKIRHLCSCLVLCLHIVSAAIPGPCQHSVTKEHLLILKKLIINQNGCLIAFTFTERQHLNEVCYIKAAFPHILDLLNTHFIYEKGSDNYRYTSSLVNLIYDIYSQKCIPPIDEEIEENPVLFARQYVALPREGLQKIEEIFLMYKKVMSENDKPVNWNCENEYSKNVPEPTIALYPQTTGTSECQCACSYYKNFIFTKLASTESASHHTQSVLTDKDKISDSTPTQISFGPSINPGLHNKTKLVFTDQKFVAGHEESRITPNLMDSSRNSSEPMVSAQHQVNSSPCPSYSNLASTPTRSALQSATSQPSKKIDTNLKSNRILKFVLVKRSLDNRKQKSMLSESLSKRLGRNKKSLLEIQPIETDNSSSEHDKHIIPTQVQLDLHTSKALQENMFKNNNKKPDCKGFRCQKNTDNGSDQNSGYHVMKEYRLLHIPVFTMCLIPAACVLLFSVLFYCKKQVKNQQNEGWTINI